MKLKSLIVLQRMIHKASTVEDLQNVWKLITKHYGTEMTDFQLSMLRVSVVKKLNRMV